MAASRIAIAALTLSSAVGCGSLIGADFDDGHLKPTEPTGPSDSPAPIDSGGQAPSAKSDAGTVTPTAEPRIVMFGGVVGVDTLPSADTWTWDGKTWTRRDVTPHPSARRDHAMAGLGNTVVLFGGLGVDGKELQDTWVWDGTKWTEKHPAHVPGARSAHAMTTANGRVMMSEGTTCDTWTWDGTDWTVRDGFYEPKPCFENHAIAPLPDTVISFGGMETSQELATTFTFFNGWTELSGVSGPSSRFGHRMAPLGTSIVLFGGMHGESPLEDTWLLDDQTKWSSKTYATHPPYRWAHAMTSFQGKVVVFGGSQGDTAVTLNDTWTFDGTKWTQAPPSASDPPTRWAHAMAATQ